MNRGFSQEWRTQFGGMIAIAAAVTAAFWIAEGPEAGILAGGWILAFVAVIHFGRSRSDTLRVMSGTGDERVRALYARAVAFAGTVIAFVVPGWWLVTVVEGDQNQTLALVSAIFGASFIAGVIWQARRS
jgi:hypothetical protein